MRDKELLSDKEKNLHAVNIVENDKDVKIKLEYSSRSQGYTYTHDQPSEAKPSHEILIGRIKGIEQFTLLNHELGHIMFDSPTTSGKELIEKWVDDILNEQGGFAETDFNYIKRQMYVTYWSALNIIEDQRIESMMSRLWLGNIKRFDKALKNMGGNFEQVKRTDPINTLLYIRFHQDKYVKNNPSYNKAKEILEDVKGTNAYGALLALRMYKPYIDDYISTMIKDFKDGSQDRQWSKSLTETNQGKRDGEGDTMSSQGRNGGGGNFKEPEETKVEIGGLVEDTDPVNNMTNNEMKEEMETAKQSGEYQIQEIKDVLAGNTKRAENRYVNTENGVREAIDQGIPLGNIANGMKRVFRKLSEIPKDVVGYDGHEVDIESFISNKIKGEELGECIIDTRYKHGASILISVDTSGSMRNRRIDDARDLVATLFKSIEDVPDINLKCLVWSSNGIGIMSVETINSLKETNKIQITKRYQLTPTHLAIAYSTETIKRMNGRKKLLIFITDGKPQYRDKGSNVPDKTLIKMSKKALSRGLRKCPNVMAMLVSTSDYAKDCCKQIFGKRIMFVDDMTEGNEIIIKRFKRLVMEVLK